MPERFPIAKRGYSIEEVDCYIIDMEKKLEAYKNREAAVSDAIVSAKVVADQIIKKAELEAEEILEDYIRGLNDIQKMLDSEKKALAEFCDEYDSVVKKYFNGSAQEITAPLKEKLIVMEQIIEEKNDHEMLKAHVKENIVDVVKNEAGYPSEKDEKSTGGYFGGNMDIGNFAAGNTADIAETEGD